MNISDFVSSSYQKGYPYKYFLLSFINHAYFLIYKPVKHFLFFLNSY